MQLFIKTKLKNTLEKEIAKSKKSVTIISNISKILLIIGLVGGTLYLLINFLSPTLNMVNVNGILKKDTSFILITSSFIYVPCLIISMCFNVLSKILVGANTSARANETLILNETTIQYTYRLKHQSPNNERHIISIDYSNIKQVEYEKQTGTLLFSGQFRSDYYNNYKKKKLVKSEEIENFIIYDYFNPSLKDTLLSKGIQIDDLK